MNKTFYKAGRYLKKYSPAILSCLASVGVVATAIMSAKATPRALYAIKSDSRIKHDGNPYAYTKKEAVLSAWKYYIPAGVICISTIMCIWGANSLSRKQQAALVSAYSLIDQSYKEYKNKLKELYGEDAHNAIIESIVKDKCECKDVHMYCSGLVSNCILDFDTKNNPDVTRTFYDAFSRRTFESTIEKVLQAEYHLNRNFMFSGIIALNDFYEFLGLDKLSCYDDLGWSYCDEYYWIDFNHQKAVLDDGLEIFIIDMVFEPTIDYLS